MPLNKIIDVQKVGRFEKLHVPTGLRFSKLNLVFGENGWGKSTIADILRSLAIGEPKIINGRETLACAGDQKVVLLVDNNQATFDSGRWQGPCPKVAVYDQVFINQNIFSGDFVSHDHLKKQYGLVVGENGVRLMGEIVAIDEELRIVGATIREHQQAIQSAITTLGANTLSIEQFIALDLPDDIDELIAEKEAAVRRLEQIDQIGRAPLPGSLPEPQSGEALAAILTSTVDGIAEDAHAKLRAHVARHHANAEAAHHAMAHEAWLEAGLAYSPDDPCPFCGQALDDRSLIDAYKDCFSDAYKELSARISQCRATLKRHIDGEYATAVRQSLGTLRTVEANWRALAGVEEPRISVPEEAITQLIEVASAIDGLLDQKQRDLVSAIPEAEVEGTIRRWDEALAVIQGSNIRIAAYRIQLENVRRAQDASDLPDRKSELSVLKARKRRHEDDMKGNIDAYLEAQIRKAALDTDTTEKRRELTAHTATVTEGLGATINAYLDRLGAGFRIDYQRPDYRGREPAASYNILINDVAVPPRAAQDDLGEASFKNTLSAGDKSVLSLAIFLATLKSRDDLEEMIVVLDDPFTSMDDFRRSFTVNEINKLTAHVAQIFVLSHEKGFLRAIWDTADHADMTSTAIQTGAPGIASLAPFDLEEATRPRHLSERDEVQNFAELSTGSPPHIRRLLRLVLEGFYRRADPELFAPQDMLGEITAKIENAPADYRFKGALENLEDVNRYTRHFHHAPVEGALVEDTNVEELKTYCRRVLEMTRGSV